MKDSEMIELCLHIACEAHKGQIDKVGLPVILHPIHVGEMGNSTEEICVGFLHDTIEDTNMTYDKLLSLGVRKDIADSVCILTHKEGVPYFDYVQSIIDSKDMVAIQVKLNDLLHNQSRAKKYGFLKQYEKCTTAIAMMGSFFSTRGWAILPIVRIYSLRCTLTGIIPTVFLCDFTKSLVCTNYISSVPNN